MVLVFWFIHLIHGKRISPAVILDLNIQIMTMISDYYVLMHRNLPLWLFCLFLVNRKLTIPQFRPITSRSKKISRIFPPTWLNGYFPQHTLFWKMSGKRLQAVWEATRKRWKHVLIFSSIFPLFNYNGSNETKKRVNKNVHHAWVFSIQNCALF